MFLFTFYLFYPLSLVDQPFQQWFEVVHDPVVPVGCVRDTFIAVEELLGHDVVVQHFEAPTTALTLA